MGDVIQFPPNAPKELTGQARNRAAHREHVQQVRQAVERAPRMGDADRRRVAENLWEILADAEQRGQSKAEIILHEGGRAARVIRPNGCRAMRSTPLCLKKSRTAELRTSPRTPAST
jgi:hypothetical protein